MAYRENLVARISLGLVLAAALGVGCASIIGADDYKVAGGGTPTSAGAAGSGAGGSTGTAGSAGSGGSGTSTCSGANPAGHAMCPAGQTCNTDTCTPLTYACFAPGTGAEGSDCVSKHDCATGMTCIGYQMVYACRVLCAMDVDCPPGYRCSEEFSCGDNPATAGKYCAKPCSDPVSPAGSTVCGAGFRCDFLCDKTTHTPLPPTCDFESGTMTSGSCMGEGDCAPGYFCLGSADGTTHTCTQGCRVNTDCTTGTCTGTTFCGPTATTYHYCK